METAGLEYVVDPRLKDKYPKGIYRDMVKLAIDCASFNSEGRPSMKVKKKKHEQLQIKNSSEIIKK